jgi:hypothetical protein
MFRYLRDKDFSTSEIGFSTFFEKVPKNASFITLKLKQNQIKSTINGENNEIKNYLGGFTA